MYYVIQGTGNCIILPHEYRKQFFTDASRGARDVHPGHNPKEGRGLRLGYPRRVKAGKPAGGGGNIISLAVEAKKRGHAHLPLGGKPIGAAQKVLSDYRSRNFSTWRAKDKLAAAFRIGSIGFKQ